MREAETFNLWQLFSFCFPILSFAVEVRMGHKKPPILLLRRLHGHHERSSSTMFSCRMLCDSSARWAFTNTPSALQETAGKLQQWLHQGRYNWLKSRPGSWTQGQSGAQANLPQIKHPVVHLTSSYQCFIQKIERQSYLRPSWHPDFNLVCLISEFFKENWAQLVIRILY